MILSIIICISELSQQSSCKKKSMKFFNMTVKNVPSQNGVLINLKLNEYYVIIEMNDDIIRLSFRCKNIMAELDF